MRAVCRLALILVWCGSALLAQETAQESEEEAAPARPKLVYHGQPLVVPLDCSYEHFNRAGIVCSDVTPCELFLELTGIESAGDKLFVIGNVHTTAATASSILLASDDNGTSWYEPIERYSGGSFELIQFINSTHGWIGGQQGEIDSSSTPILLATRDGGSRWERHPIWDDDENSGAILAFYFDTEDHGYLIIDRLVSEGDPYELYESMNGGRSWGIRQISAQRPELRNRPPAGRAPPAWGLREDPQAGLYVVEHREGGTWVDKARFSAKIGSCVTMDREAPE